MSTSKVSTSVLKRLPRYYRFLGELKDMGTERISSSELSKKTGLTASQIRQDFNCFGGFGQQGYGYNVEQLHREIGLILGLYDVKKIVLIGAGNLGRAVAEQMDLKERGFQLVGIFDKKESIVGQMIAGIPVMSIEKLDDFCRDNRPVAAILCVPKNAAAPIVEQLVKLGIKGIWNFSHYDISMKYPHVAVENVHLSDSLMSLCYKITHIGEDGEKEV